MKHKEDPLYNILLSLLALSRLTHTSPLMLLECNTEITLHLLLPWTGTQSQQGSWTHLTGFVSRLTFLCQRCPINRTEFGKMRGMAKSYLNNLFLKSTEMLLVL